MVFTRKIKKDNTENYFVSFKQQAQHFYLNNKIKKIKSQKPIYNIFFNENEFIDNISELNSNGFTIIRNFFDKKILKNISDKTDKFISNGQKLEGVRDNLRELRENKKFFERIWLNNEQIKEMSKTKLRNTTNGISIKDPLINNSEIIKVISSVKFIKLLFAYYECIPELTYIKIRKAFANKLPANDTQFFHRDSGSFKLLKAVIYLNDVDINTGPFTFVKGSTRKFDFPKHKLRFKDHEIASHYGKSNIKHLTAKRGDLVLANTTGFHKGLKPKLKDRNVCIANFCVHDELGFSYDKIKIKKNKYNNLNHIQKHIFKNLNKV